MTRNAATGPARTGLVVTLLLLWMTPGSDLLGLGLIGVSAVGYPHPRTPLHGAQQGIRSDASAASRYGKLHEPSAIR
jgi:hypothetical protein